MPDHKNLQSKVERLSICEKSTNAIWIEKKNAMTALIILQLCTHKYLLKVIDWSDTFLMFFNFIVKDSHKMWVINVLDKNLRKSTLYVL